jgi:predicted AAA+ superfamily ATPase
MLIRGSWQSRIERAWRRRSVVWLMGVRRAGKTWLAQSLPAVEYLDCELPRVRRSLEDPESFLEASRGRRVVLDEIHRLPDPAAILKIAADHFPTTRVLATGSSTLGASARFRDTLAGRKEEVWLTPMTRADLDDFGDPSLERRLLRGGLPPFFLAERLPERDFQEWLDAYWAKDILELFRLERRSSFQRFFELLLAGSGGIFEAARFSRACEVSRTTIANYLAALEATFVVHVLRPFSAGTPHEIVAAPKVYGFDTGFVCYHRGWSELRREDMGLLWEHFVLNEIHARLQMRRVFYWRSKRGNEVDLVLAPRGGTPVAVECKHAADGFDPANLRAFRLRFPKGRNYVVAADVDRPFARRYGTLTVRFAGLGTFVDELGSLMRRSLRTGAEGPRADHRRGTKDYRSR